MSVVERHLVARILEHQLSLDLTHVGITWSVKPARTIPQRFSMMGDTGSVVYLELNSLDLMTQLQRG